MNVDLTLTVSCSASNPVLNWWEKRVPIDRAQSSVLPFCLLNIARMDPQILRRSFFECFVVDQARKEQCHDSMCSLPDTSLFSLPTPRTNATIAAAN